MYLIVSVSFLLVFFLSTILVTYSFWKSQFGIYNAYLIDELFFFFVFCFLSTYLVLKRRIRITFEKIVTSAFLIVFTFFVLGELLSNFFIGDDLFVMFPVLNNLQVLEQHYTARLDYYYYHFLPFSLLYKFFGYQSFYFNLFAIFTMAVSGIALYYFLRYLGKILKFKGRIFPLVVCMFYLSVPNILGHFRFTEHGVAIGSIATFTVVCLYLYLKFLNDGKRDHIYFILSYVLILLLLRTSLTRVGFLPVVLMFMEVFYFSRKVKSLGGTIARVIILFLPFYIIGKPYFVVGSSPGALYGIGLERLINFNRLYLGAASLIAYLVPNQFFPSVVNYIQHLVLIGKIKESFVLNNLFFSAGLIMFGLMSLTLQVLYIRKHNVKLAIVFWISSLVCTLFYALAGGGNTVTLGEKMVFDRGMNFFIMGFTGAAYTIIPLIFLVITLYLIFVNRIKSLRVGKKMYYVICVALLLVSISNIHFTKLTIKEMVGGPKAYRVLVDNVLRVVPDNSEKKVIYSTNGIIPEVKFIGVGGVSWFFKNSTPLFIMDEEELIEFLSKNKIKPYNFYAFFFDNKRFIFKDQSERMRLEMKKYLSK